MVAVGFSCKALHPAETCKVHVNQEWWPFATRDERGLDIETFTLPFLIYNDSFPGREYAPKMLSDIVPAIQRLATLFEEEGNFDDFASQVRFYSSVICNTSPAPEVYWAERAEERWSGLATTTCVYHESLPYTHRLTPQIMHRMLANAQTRFLPALQQMLAARRARFNI